MEWALVVASVGLVVVTGGLVWFTRGLVAEARLTRDEMGLTREEMAETRRLAVRPHLTLEPIMLGPNASVLGLRNMGPGAARNIKLQIEFAPMRDVRDLAIPVLLPGDAQEFLLPDGLMYLNDALAAELVSNVDGTMEDLYGFVFDVELAFEWAPWVEKLTDAKRRATPDPTRPIADALKDIKKEVEKLRGDLARRDTRSPK